VYVVLFGIVVFVSHIQAPLHEVCSIANSIVAFVWPVSHHCEALGQSCRLTIVSQGHLYDSIHPVSTNFICTKLVWTLWINIFRLQSSLHSILACRIILNIRSVAVRAETGTSVGLHSDYQEMHFAEQSNEHWLIYYNDHANRWFVWMDELSYLLLATCCSIAIYSYLDDC
jgi:hypothetical protein